MKRNATDKDPKTPEQFADYIWGTEQLSCSECGATENLTHVVSPYVGSNPNYYLCPKCLAKLAKENK